MNSLHITTNPAVENIFIGYPKQVGTQMARLRKLILETAKEIKSIDSIEETLKWNEPSYLTKQGSTIRIDWKNKTPDQYAIYFQCTSRLVPVFKAVYGNLFNYEGTRAIIFKLDDKLPETELKSCIAAGLTYHKVKQLPLLGL